MMKCIVFLTAVAAALASAVDAEAAVVGQWSGSARSWNHPDMATMSATAIGAGHIITPNISITAPNFVGLTHFLIGEGTVAPSAGELAILTSFVTNGGILMVMNDSGGSGAASSNAVLAGIGSTITVGPAGASGTLLQSGNFASDGPPFNIAGMNLSVTPGTAVNGGTILAGSFIRYEQIGSGFVFVFGDRSDHNFFGPTNANVNGQLFLNILGAEIQAVPEPASLALWGIGSCLGLIAVRRRAKSKACAV